MIAYIYYLSLDIANWFVLDAYIMYISNKHADERRSPSRQALSVSDHA